MVAVSEEDVKIREKKETRMTMEKREKVKKTGRKKR